MCSYREQHVKGMHAIIIYYFRLCSISSHINTLDRCFLPIFINNVVKYSIDDRSWLYKYAFLKGWNSFKIPRVHNQTT